MCSILQSKDVGIRTVVMLDEQGGKQVFLGLNVKTCLDHEIWNLLGFFVPQKFVFILKFLIVSSFFSHNLAFLCKYLWFELLVWKPCQYTLCKHAHLCIDLCSCCGNTIKLPFKQSSWSVLRRVWTPSTGTWERQRRIWQTWPSAVAFVSGHSGSRSRNLRLYPNRP